MKQKTFIVFDDGVIIKMNRQQYKAMLETGATGEGFFARDFGKVLSEDCTMIDGYGMYDYQRLLKELEEE